MGAGDQLLMKCKKYLDVQVGKHGGSPVRRLRGYGVGASIPIMGEIAETKT